MSIFQDRLRAQKDHNSNEIFVMGPAQCAGPMTKISLLLWSFCACGWTLKIVVCKKLQGQPGIFADVHFQRWTTNETLQNYQRHFVTAKSQSLSRET